MVALAAYGFPIDQTIGFQISEALGQQGWRYGSKAALQIKFWMCVAGQVLSPDN